MKCKVENLTKQTQQIQLCDGSCVTLFPRNFAEVEFDLVSKEEYERIKSLLKIVQPGTDPYEPVWKTIKIVI